jgi:hypothetical protein
MPPVTCFPSFKSTLSESPDDPSWDLEYRAFGSESEQDIVAALYPQLSANNLGLWLGKYTMDHKGGGFWEIQVHYQKTRPIGTGYVVFNAESGNKTVHKENSISTVDNFIPTLAPNPPDFQGLIGVDVPAGTVAGVDVVTPSFAFTASVKMAAALLPSNYLDGIWRMVGSQNLGPITIVWKGQVINMDVGEVLFLGFNVADGGQDQTFGELIELNFKFDTSPNRSNFDVAGITVTQKAGWDYLWVLRRTVPVGSGDSAALAMQGRAVYVEQVYPSADLTQLGIFQLTE